MSRLMALSPAAKLAVAVAGIVILAAGGGAAYLLLHPAGRAGSPVAAASPTTSPGPVAEASPDPTAEPTATPSLETSPTAAPPESTPTPVTAGNHGTPTPSHSSTPPPTPVPTPTPASTPTPVSTPTPPPPSPTPIPTPVPTPTPISCTLSSSSSVAIFHSAFSPSSLCVAPGTTVVWTQMDSINHNVAATSSNWTYTSPTLTLNQTASFTFNTPGIYHYHCGFHPFTMVGTVTVPGPAPALRTQARQTVSVLPAVRLLALNDSSPGCRCCCEEGCC
jgi:hypothetical protein